MLRIHAFKNKSSVDVLDVMRCEPGLKFYMTPTHYCYLTREASLALAQRIIEYYNENPTIEKTNLMEGTI